MRITVIQSESILSAALRRGRPASIHAPSPSYAEVSSPAALPLPSDLVMLITTSLWPPLLTRCLTPQLFFLKSTVRGLCVILSDEHRLIAPPFLYPLFWKAVLLPVMWNGEKAKAVCRNWCHSPAAVQRNVDPRLITKKLKIEKAVRWLIRNWFMAVLVCCYQWSVTRRPTWINSVQNTVCRVKAGN